jgi:hypothetical protein
MKTTTSAVLLGIAALLVVSSASAEKVTRCYGFEVDAGQLDEVGADQLRFDMAGTGNALNPAFNANENVWLCKGDVLGTHPLTSYSTYTDKKGHRYAVGH